MFLLRCRIYTVVDSTSYVKAKRGKKMYQYATQIAPYYNRRPPEKSDYDIIDVFFNVFIDKSIGTLSVAKIHDLQKIVWNHYAQKFRLPIGPQLSEKMTYLGKTGILRTALNNEKISKLGEHGFPPIATAIIKSCWEYIAHIAQKCDAVMTFRWGIAAENIKEDELTAIISKILPIPTNIETWSVKK